ncbi:hypothetical protein [Kitasatospora sp. NPDC059327]|uniref:hypothetical protein n=1 Tax=Kitasatospora sp. NPDC059327 TaxID=3346803 RepID=UPI00368A2093
MGRRRGRTALDTLAALAESAVDVYGRDLAQELAMPCGGMSEATTGRQVTTLLRKDQPPGSAEPDRSTGPVTSSS